MSKSLDMLCVGGGKDGVSNGWIDHGITHRSGRPPYPTTSLTLTTNEVIIITPASDNDIDPSDVWDPTPMGTTEPAQKNYLNHASILRREAFPIYDINLGSDDSEIITTYEHLNNNNIIFSHVFESNKKAYYTTRVSPHYVITGSDGCEWGSGFVQGIDEYEPTLRIDTEPEWNTYSPNPEDYLDETISQRRIWDVDNEGYELGVFNLGYILIPLGTPDNITLPFSHEWETNFPFNLSNGNTWSPQQHGITIKLNIQTDLDLSVKQVQVYNYKMYNGYLKQDHLIGTINNNGTLTINKNNSNWSTLISSDNVIPIFRHQIDSSLASKSSATINYRYGACICLGLIANFECETQPATDIPIDVKCDITFPFLIESSPYYTEKSDYTCIFGSDYISERVDPVVHLISAFKTHSETPVVTIPEVTWSWHNNSVFRSRVFNLPKLTSSSSSDASVYIGEFKLSIPNTSYANSYTLIDFYSSSAPVTFVQDYNYYYSYPSSPSRNDVNLNLTLFNEIDEEEVSKEYEHVLNFYPERTKDVFTKYGLAYPEVLVSVYSNRYVSDSHPLQMRHDILAQTVAMSSYPDNPDYPTTLYWADPTWIGPEDDESALGIFSIDYKQGMWLEVFNPNTNTFDYVDYNMYENEVIEPFNVNKYGKLNTETNKIEATFRIYANNNFKAIIPEGYSGYDPVLEANRMISEKLENSLIIYPSIRLHKFNASTSERSTLDLPISLMKNDNGDVENGQLHDTLLDDEYENPDYIFENDCNLTEWNHEIYLKRDTDLDSYSYGNYNKTLLENRNKVSSDFAGPMRLDAEHEHLALSNYNHVLLNFINHKSADNNDLSNPPYAVDDFYGLYNLYKCAENFNYSGEPEYAYKKYVLSDVCYFDLMNRRFIPVSYPYRFKEDNYFFTITDKWKQCVYSLKCNSSTPKTLANTHKVNIEFIDGCGFTHTERFTKNKDYIYVVCRETNDIVRRSINNDTLPITNLWHTGYNETNYDGIDTAIASVHYPGGTYYYYKINDNCIRCGSCTNNVCPVNAIKVTSSGPYTIDKNMCIDCGKCVNEINCPAGAIGITSEVKTEYTPAVTFDIYYLYTTDDNPHYNGYLLDSISTGLAPVGGQYKQIWIDHDIEIPLHAH